MYRPCDVSLSESSTVLYDYACVCLYFPRNVFNVNNQLMMSRVCHQMYRLLLAVVLMATLCVTVSALRCYFGHDRSYMERECGSHFQTCVSNCSTVAGMCIMRNIAYFITLVADMI